MMTLTDLTQQAKSEYTETAMRDLEPQLKGGIKANELGAIGIMMGLALAKSFHWEWQYRAPEVV
jgi:hypothetical protein